MITQSTLPGIFLWIFSSFACLKKPVFSKRDLLWWKVPTRLYWDRLTIVQYIVVSSSRKNTKPNGGRASFPRKAQILPFTYIARLLLIQRRVNGGSTN
jgi:hypothetical protein